MQVVQSRTHASGVAREARNEAVAPVASRPVGEETGPPPTHVARVYIHHHAKGPAHLGSLGGVGLVSIFADAQKGSDMWGMIAKITVLPGKRDEMIGILKSSAANMPGCFSYVVAKDATGANVVWITEVWDSQASHDASLSLPAVKEAIPRGKALVASFERFAVTTPVWGTGLPKAEQR